MSNSYKSSVNGDKTATRSSRSSPLGVHVEEYSDEDEFASVDPDMREILLLEQSHISHVGLMDNLRHFYLAHNPRILQSPNFLTDLINTFSGRESQLYEKLKETYGKGHGIDTNTYAGELRYGGRAPAMFLRNITMEGMLLRKPTRKGMRGRVQEIMEPTPRWFELSGTLLVWSKGPKHNPRGRIRLVAGAIAEANGERYFRYIVNGKVRLRCQAKTVEIRDQWIAAMNQVLEHLAMEVKQAEARPLSTGSNYSHDLVDPSSDLQDVSRITDVESEADEEEVADERRVTQNREKRNNRIGVALDDTSSGEEEVISATSVPVPISSAATQVVTLQNGALQVAVTPTIVSNNKNADEAVKTYKSNVRKSLSIAKRKILFASGIIAVTALTMQYYGIVPVLISSLIGMLCIFGRFLDSRDNNVPHPAGTIVLSGVASLPFIATTSISPSPSTKAPSRVSNTRTRRSIRQNIPKVTRNAHQVKHSRRTEVASGGSIVDHSSNDDEAQFADCIDDSIAGIEKNIGGASKFASGPTSRTGTPTGTPVEQEFKQAEVENDKPKDNDKLPPLHLYGDLGVRFLPSERNIIPCGLSLKLNDDFNPVNFESEFFKGRMVLRIKDAIGAPKTNYFDGRRRLFSIQIEGRFKKRLRTDCVLFGSQFVRKLKPPRGTNIAISILKSIDSALEVDLFRDENPWIMSPLVCAVERMQVRHPDPDDTENNGLGPWRYGGAVAIEEDSSLILSPEKRNKMGDKKMSFGQRRKYFGDIKKRSVTYWEPDLVYTFDFLSARMDFNTYKVKMAKFIEFGTTKVMNQQPFELEARVVDLDTREVIGNVWALEFCHNKVAPFSPDMELIDHSNDDMDS